MPPSSDLTQGVVPTGASPQLTQATHRPQRHRAVKQRLLVFPLLLNVWPLLLLVSQKALVPLGLLLGGWGTRAYRRDLLVALAVIFAGAVTLILQRPNEYAAAHYAGYALFVLSVPLLNAALRNSRQQLLRGLAVLSVINSVLAFVFYFLEVDMSSFRGLNRIIGTDELTHRVYFETTSLLAIYSPEQIRGKVLRWLCTVIVIAYAVLLAKSVFVIVLFLVNRYAHIALFGSSLRRVMIVIMVVAAGVFGPIVAASLRPDIAFSIGAKLLQLEQISQDAFPVLSGAGWGYVIEEIVNSPEQPYQIEMQLPMLVSQIGWAGTTLFAMGMLLFVRSTGQAPLVTWLRWLTYLSIGFNNPWLLIPSWYLTTALMYVRLERRES